MIELMVMLAVLAIVMSVGVPQLTIFFRGSDMVANANDLVGGFHITRSAAINQGGRVTICKSSVADIDPPVCETGAAANWEDGWFVFVEGTQVGNVIGTYTPGTDGPVLRVNTGAEGRDSGTTIRTATANIDDFVSFSSRGLPTESNGISVSGVYMVCDDRGLTNASGNVVARGIVLQASGRVGVSKVASQLGVCP